MNHTMKSLRYLLLGAIIAGTLSLTSCSNKPTEDELRQLAALRAEVNSLQLQIETKKKEKEDLEKQIKDKQAKLQSILDEQKAAESSK